MLREFLERNVKDFNYRTFLVIKLQFLMFAMLIFIFARPLTGFVLFAFGEAILSAYYMYVVLVKLKPLEKSERQKYLLFFSAALLFIQLAWVLPFALETGFLVGNYLLPLLLAMMILFVFLFRIFFGRDYTYGTVLLGNETIAVVQTEFDLLSFTNAGKFIVENNKKKEGDKVKLAVKNLVFYRKPSNIL